MNTRIAVRKARGGKSGDEHYFSVREVTLPEPDEDGDPVETLVIDWNAKVTPSAGPTRDPWEQETRADANAANKLLQRVLMAKIASHGCEVPLDPPTDPPIRGIDIEIVRAEFYARTPAEGDEKKKRDLRQKRFDRAVVRAQKRLLIDVREINGKTYIWLLQQHPDASNF
jgi:hypothetical protein